MEIKDKFVLSRNYRRDYKFGLFLYLCLILFLGYLVARFPDNNITFSLPAFIIIVKFTLSILCAPSEFLLEDDRFIIKYPFKSTIIPFRDIVSVDVIPSNYFKGIWWRSLQLRFKGIQGMYFNKDGNTDYYFICNYNERVRILLKWDKSYIISFTDMEFVKQLYKQFGQLRPEDDK